MRVRSYPAAVDVPDLIASFSRILGDVVEHDTHDRDLPVRIALSREIDFLRAGILAPEPLAEEAG